jgi:hypothetical protein
MPWPSVIMLYHQDLEVAVPKGRKKISKSIKPSIFKNQQINNANMPLHRLDSPQ